MNARLLPIGQPEENLNIARRELDRLRYGKDKVAAYRQRKAIDDFKHHLNDVYCMLYGRYIADEDIEALVL